MTSQIVLFNGSGVAIASDSAQTSGGSVVDTAEKIFPGPGSHQIAVIISGAAYFDAYPVSTLLAEWFGSLGTRRKSSARAYSDSFIEFLNCSSLFSDEGQLRHLYSCLNTVVDKIVRILDDADQYEHEELPVRMVLAAKTFEDTLNMGFLDGASEVWCERLSSFLTTELVGTWCHDIWPKYFTVVSPDGFEVPAAPEDSEIEALRQTLIRYVSTSLWFQQITHVAVVGYGENEIMPSFFDRDIRAHFFGQTLGRIQNEQKFDSSASGRYVGYRPLAQSDAIDSFVRGFQMDFLNAAREKISVSLVTQSSSSESQSEELLDAVRSQSVEALNQAFFENDRLDSFLENISGLPVASLASVAQSLIQVQALSILLRGQLRTVGGPIDTAVISRADGFLWNQHKSITSSL
jgi:hypothetical protein